MRNYLETKIRDIDDPDFQSLVDELCQCIGFARDEFDNQRFSFLLMVIGRERRESRLLRKYLPVERILGRRVDKLHPDSVVYEVCKQLATINNTILEAFGGARVLTLIKRTYKIFCPGLYEKPANRRRRR